MGGERYQGGRQAHVVVDLDAAEVGGEGLELGEEADHLVDERRRPAAARRGGRGFGGGVTARRGLSGRAGHGGREVQEVRGCVALRRRAGRRGAPDPLGGADDGKVRVALGDGEHRLRGDELAPRDVEHREGADAQRDAVQQLLVGDEAGAAVRPAQVEGRLRLQGADLEGEKPGKGSCRLPADAGDGKPAAAGASRAEARSARRGAGPARRGPPDRTHHLDPAGQRRVLLPALRPLGGGARALAGDVRVFINGLLRGPHRRGVHLRLEQRDAEARQPAPAMGAAPGQNVSLFRAPRAATRATLGGLAQRTTCPASGSPVSAGTPSRA